METFQIAKHGASVMSRKIKGCLSGLTVEEKSLKVAMKKQDDQHTKEIIETVLRLFPDLKKYWKKESGSLKRRAKTDAIDRPEAI